jgi:hypothetical protein
MPHPLPIVTGSDAGNLALHLPLLLRGPQAQAGIDGREDPAAAKEHSMNARTSILSLAIVALGAATGAAFAYGPGPQAGMGPRAAAPLDPAQAAERMQARLNSLKDALKLQPAQVDAWNAYAATITTEAQARAQMRQGMLDSRGDSQAMADQHVAHMKHNAQAAEEINGMRKALLATLSAEQKATFEQYAVGPGQGMRGGRGPGPGYGPGPGAGRGMGYGRGCAGAG